MEREVIKFISAFTGEAEDNIQPSTIINDDLGIDGDDGDELLMEFSSKFNVDLTPITETYFGSEGLPLYFLILWPFHLLRWILGYKSNDLTPLPVSQLIKSAEEGTWTNV